MKTFSKYLLGLIACVFITGCDSNMTISNDLSQKLNAESFHLPANAEKVKCEIDGVMHKYYTCTIQNKDTHGYVKAVNLDITKDTGNSEEKAEYYTPGSAKFEFTVMSGEKGLVVMVSKDNQLTAMEQFAWLNLLLVKTVVDIPKVQQ